MTKGQALAEARRRWGPRAYVTDGGKPVVNPDTGAVVCRRYRVGVVRAFTLASFTEIFGDGDSWEKALADATRKGHAAK